MKRFIFYVLRWQLSSPILALCWCWLDGFGVAQATIIANFIGACLFFFVDRKIFFSKKDEIETLVADLISGTRLIEKGDGSENIQSRNKVRTNNRNDLKQNNKKKAKRKPRKNSRSIKNHR